MVANSLGVSFLQQEKYRIVSDSCSNCDVQSMVIYPHCQAPLCNADRPEYSLVFKHVLRFAKCTIVLI